MMLNPVLKIMNVSLPYLNPQKYLHFSQAVKIVLNLKDWE